MSQTGNRRRSRVYALQILYALENGSEDAPRQAVDAYRHHFGTEVEGDVLDFARTLVSRVSDNQHKVDCLLYTSPSPRDATLSRMPSSA